MHGVYYLKQLGHLYPIFSVLYKLHTADYETNSGYIYNLQNDKHKIIITITGIWN